MRNVGNSQQQVMQDRFHLGELFVEGFFVLAQPPALGHERLSVFLVAAQRTDLFGDVVDFGPNRVALCGDVAQPRIESHGMVDVLEQFGLGTTCKRLAHRLGLRTQQPDVNHNEAG